MTEVTEQTHRLLLKSQVGTREIFSWGLITLEGTKRDSEAHSWSGLGHQDRKSYSALGIYKDCLFGKSWGIGIVAWFLNLRILLFF